MADATIHSGQTLKRGYRSAAAAAADGGGWTVRLDDALLRSPAGRPAIFGSQALAEAIAAEWAAQGDRIAPSTMPLFRLVATALDRVEPDPAPTVAGLLRYGATDLLCYRAETPPELVARQAHLWQPLIEWAAIHFGAELRVATGLMPLPQPPAALDALRAVFLRMDAFRLTALAALAAVSGSAVLALAVAERYLSPDEAWAASQLDETFQAERWGEDAEATAQRANARQDFLDSARFLGLLDAE